MVATGTRSHTSFGELFCLFAAIVSLIVWFSSWNTNNRLLAEFEKDRIKQLESEIEHLVVLSSDESYVYARFSSIIEAINNYGINSPELKDTLSEVKNKFDISCKAFIYKNGQLQKTEVTDKNEIELFSPMISNLELSGKAFEDAQKSINNSLQKYFLPNHRLKLIKENKGNLVRYVMDDKDRFYYWNSYSNGFSVFLIAERYPEFIDRFKRSSGSRKQSGAGDLNKQKFIPPEGVTEDQMLAARIKANNTLASSVVAFGQIWYFLNDASGTFWCTTRENISRKQDLPAWIILLHYFSIIAFFTHGLMLIFSLLSLPPGTVFCRYFDSFSIKAKTACFFAMASLFPVVLTILFGMHIIADKTAVIENSVLSDSLTALEPMQNIPAVLFAGKLRLTRELRNRLAKESPSAKLIKETIIRHGIAETHTEVELRDESSKILYSTLDRELQGAVEAIEVFCRLAIKQHTPHRLSDKTNRITPAEIVTESIIATNESGMTQIMRKRDNLWGIQMGTSPTEWYWDVYPELATGPSFISISFCINTTVKHYIHNKLQPIIPAAHSFILATEINHRTSNFKITPKIHNEAGFLATSIASFRSGKIVMKDCQINNSDYWIVAKPGKNSTHLFLYLTSKEKRLKELIPLKVRIAVGGIMALLISLLGATLISRLLITPLSDLDSALSAIKQRNDSYRCPVRRSDELGLLADAFNKVIAEIKNLEFGKLLQESLLPGHPVSPMGYDLALFTISATDMAGDYHDTLQLNDGKIAIVVGDVTGHGISASLAMAMAKATLLYVGNEQEAFPYAFMNRLNDLFCGELKASRKKMTLITVVLDPATGLLEIDNAGQSFPRYFERQSLTSFDIELPSVPVGVMKRRKPAMYNRTMNKGDAIVLFTDGIIECTADKNEMFGYERFYEAFEHAIQNGLSAKETINSMISKLEQFRSSGAYPDDITLAVLKRTI